MSSTLPPDGDTSIGVAIVDDDRPYAEALAELLALGTEIEVVGIATSVAEGIELLSNSRVQLGLVDVHMPDGGGLRVVETVKEWANQPALALISSEAPNEASLAAGVEFLPKVRIEQHHLVEIVRSSEL